MIYRLAAAVFFMLALYTVLAALGSGEGRSPGLFGAVVFGWVGAWLWGKATGRSAAQTFGKAIEVKGTGNPSGGGSRHGGAQTDTGPGQSADNAPVDSDTVVPAVVAYLGTENESPASLSARVAEAVEAGVYHLHCCVHLNEAGEPCLLRKDAAYPGPLQALLAQLQDWPGVILLVSLDARAQAGSRTGAALKPVLEVLRPQLAQCVIVCSDAQALARARTLGPVPIGWAINPLPDDAQRAAERRAEQPAQTTSWLAERAERARALAPEYLLLDARDLGPQEVLCDGPWEWLVAPVEDEEQALALAARGARLVGSSMPGKLLQALGPPTDSG